MLTKGGNHAPERQSSGQWAGGQHCAGMTARPYMQGGYHVPE